MKLKGCGGFGFTVRMETWIIVLVALVAIVVFVIVVDTILKCKYVFPFYPTLYLSTYCHVLRCSEQKSCNNYTTLLRSCSYMYILLYLINNRNQ